LELQEVLKRDPQNVPARLQLGYLQLSAGDRRASGTLENAVSGASAPRSTLGAAKVYLALALDAEARADSRGSSGRRAEEVLKQGLSLHRNLQCVWQEIERGLLAEQPLQAVQRLRGICDLDLTSLQARQLLQLLVRATGRQDLLRALGAGSGAATPDVLRMGGASRPGSLPPSRWGGSGGPPEDGGPQRLRSGSPYGNGNMQREHLQRERIDSRATSPRVGSGAGTGPPQWGSGMQGPSGELGRTRRMPPSRPLSPGTHPQGPRGSGQPGQDYMQGQRSNRPGHGHMSGMQGSRSNLPDSRPLSPGMQAARAQPSGPPRWDQGGGGPGAGWGGDGGLQPPPPSWHQMQGHGAMPQQGPWRSSQQASAPQTPYRG